MIRRYLSVGVLAVAFAFAPASFASEKENCCTKTAALVKEGKACAKCAEHQCCKDTAKAEMKKMADAGKKMEKCEGCEAAKKKAS